MKISLAILKAVTTIMLFLAIGNINRNIDTMNSNVLAINGYDPKTGQKAVPPSQQKVPIFDDPKL